MRPVSAASHWTRAPGRPTQPVATYRTAGVGQSAFKDRTYVDKPHTESVHTLERLKALNGGKNRFRSWGHGRPSGRLRHVVASHPALVSNRSWTSDRRHFPVRVVNFSSVTTCRMSKKQKWYPCPVRHRGRIAIVGSALTFLDAPFATFMDSPFLPSRMRHGSGGDGEAGAVLLGEEPW
jgi:hypothetical protein